MTTQANLEVIPLRDEYNAPHKQAYGAILKAKFLLEEGVEAKEVGDTYKEETLIVGALCELIFYSDKQSHDLGFDPRHLRQKEKDGSYSNTIVIDATTPEAKQIINSSLGKQDKLFRIIKNDLARR